MNYLFFDIECANCFGGQGKICSFGYVVTDSKLNILMQEDIVINPQSKFHLIRKDGSCDIQLGYTEQEFLSAPTFDEFYDKIKALLQTPDQLCFGHSVNNDINFILSECHRYNVPNIDIKAYDTQMLYKYFKKEMSDSGLEKIATIYGLPIEGLHRSDYDAYLTMQVLKSLCSDFGVDVEGLLDICQNAFYTAIDGKLENHFSASNPSKQLLEFAKRVRPFGWLREEFCKALDLPALLQEYFSHKELIYFGQINIDIKLQMWQSAKGEKPMQDEQASSILLSPIQREKILTVSKNIWSRCFCFNQVFEKDNYKKCLFLIRRIRLLGGYYCNKIGKADYFIVGSDACLRQKQLPKLQDKESAITAISEQEICNILGLNFDEYCNAENMSITKIKSYNFEN